MLLCLVLHIGGSFMCMCAPTSLAFMIGRCIQGLGEGTSGITQAMVRDSIDDPEERVRILSVLTALDPFVVCVAPLVGSAVASFLGWRAMFCILGLWSILNFCAFSLALPETKADGAQQLFVSEHVSEIVCHRRPWYLALTFSCIFALIFSMLGNVAFILDDFGISTLSSGMLIASIAPFVSIGAFAGNIFLHSGKSLSESLPLAMFAELILNIAGILVGISYMHWKWAIMSAFYVIAFGMGLCGPMLMTLALDPFTHTRGLVGGIIYGLQNLIGAIASAVTVLAREQHGIPAMFLGFMLVHVIGHVIFWSSAASSKRCDGC